MVHFVLANQKLPTPKPKRITNLLNKLTSLHIHMHWKHQTKVAYYFFIKLWATCKQIDRDMGLNAFWAGEKITMLWNKCNSFELCSARNYSELIACVCVCVCLLKWGKSAQNNTPHHRMRNTGEHEKCEHFQLEPRPNRQLASNWKDVENWAF